MAKTKMEALIEHILNDNESAASELFHDIVVEKSREIYNNIVAEDEEKEVEESTLEEFGMEDSADDMQSDIEADQTGLDVGGDEGADEHGDEHHDDEGGIGDEPSGDEDIEDRVVDLESALDELKAEFDQLMAKDGDELGGDSDIDIDGEGHEDGGFGGDDDHEFGGESDEEPMPEGMVREYVEKAPQPVKTETNVNAKSPVAGKNDMGGTTANIAKGGTNANPTGPSKPNNAYTKGQTDMGAVDTRTAGKTAFGKKAPSAKTGEEGNTNTTSPLAK